MASRPRQGVGGPNVALFEILPARLTHRTARQGSSRDGAAALMLRPAPLDAADLSDEPSDRPLNPDEL
jgi:hypothetical protein